jgi:hypothetical protein
MPSQEMSPLEARDLLHKLITESTKVQAVLFCPVGTLNSFVSGKVYAAPNGSVVVIERDDHNSSMLGFDPAKGSSVYYGDERVVREHHNPGADLFRLEFSSGMKFSFPDGSDVAIFEMKT